MASARAVDVKNQRCTLVKPEKSLRREFRQNIFDKKASDMHIAVLFVYNKPGTFPNSQIMLGLSMALSYYPQLAGRLSHGHIIVDDNSGVSVFETTVAVKLDDFLPLESSPRLYALHPQAKGSNPMLMVQLNRFSCGGLVIGICASHKVADGQGMSNFFLAWSRLVRSPELELDHHQPIHDLESHLVPRESPICRHPHEKIEFTDSRRSGKSGQDLSNKIDNLIVHYSWEFIDELKERASSSSTKPSTFACLLSHVWRKACLARGLRDDEVTSVRVLVNGRPRLGISSQFFGNVVLDAYASTTVKELLKEGVGNGARLIKEAVAKIDSDYFQSFIDFGELVDKDKELVPSTDVDGEFLSPNLEVDSWLGFRFHEVDMGAGAPYAFRPSWIPMEGVVVFVPARSSQEAGQGGVNAIVTLFKEYAEMFKNIAHLID
ncbi:unnamed protein product [Victoria cruziana]